MLAMTPTKLSDYLLCPYKYKLRHVDKIADSGTNSAALSFGQTMHSALQDLHHSPNGKRQDFADISELLTKYWTPAAYTTAEEDESYFLKGCRALHSYCEALAGDSFEMTLGTEVYMSYILKFGRLQVRLGCKADRVCVHPNELLEVIDYKTNGSGKVPTLESLRGDLPTFLYYILARITYPEYKHLQISFLNVLTLARVSVKYAPAQISANKQALLECLSTLDANNFIAAPSEACSWCQFQDICVAANRVIDFSGIT